MNEQMRAGVAAFEQTVRSTLALAAGFGEDDWDRPTDCPGWTVKDQLSHLVGIERDLLGDPSPEIEVPDFDHIRNDFGRALEVAVHARRTVPGPAVAAELAETLERRLAQLATLDPDRPVLCPDGREGPYSRLMRFRAMDCWTHEQDVRRALGRPGNLGAPAGRCFWDLQSAALPIVVARRAKAAPGQSVALRITGEHDHHVAVAVDGDNRGHWTAPEDPTVELAMSWETYVRLAAGRAKADALSIRVEGDEDLAARVLANASVMP